MNLAWDLLVFTRFMLFTGKFNSKVNSNQLTVNLLGIVVTLASMSPAQTLSESSLNLNKMILTARD